MTDPFKTYLQALQTALAGGDATEHTHRPALKTLLESLGSGIEATNEPKQVTDFGKPDMKVRRGIVPLGHIETKDIGKDLNVEEKSEQLKRYLKGYPNLILTDYLEFRWYVKGELRAGASLGKRLGNQVIKGKPVDRGSVQEILQQFFTIEIPTIGTAKELAEGMASLARWMRDAALKTLEIEPDTGTLKGWLATFEQTLLPNLTAEEFADMYAQTLAYGLFSVKVTVGTAINLRRDTAASLLPPTNPLLRKLFHHLAGLDVPDSVAWALDDLIALLNAADMVAVMEDFGKGSLEKDPVVHFYETFLAAYDKEKRKSRGVYYTPEPVVSYIVKSIDHLLKERFGRPWGLADRNTLILDPACGTGTFLHSVIALIYEFLNAHGQMGVWKGEKGYVSQNLLPRVFGFELLMAPYAMAHLKLGLALKDRGYDFPKDSRLGVYLTNTLDKAIKKTEAVLGPIGYITEESNTAAIIKKEERIEVILGNPPYAGHSANASYMEEPIKDKKTGKVILRKGQELTKKVKTWIGQLLEDYKKVDGQPLGEKNPKWLHDDYVKFLRWGQWRITQTGQGILAMITNHGYLDNPTFRGMRQSLMQTFSEIYVLNLHGNAKKKEVCLDGSKDENVFDIQQGVSIGIFIKRPGGPIPAQVYYDDLWGLRKGKEKALAEMDLSTTPWRQLQPCSPYYLFVPQEMDLWAEYELGWKVTDIFPVNSVGIVTARDHLTIKWSAGEVWETVNDFASLPEEEAREKYKLGDDVRDWKVSLAQKDIKNSGPDRKKVVPILYRPFDVRFTYYSGQSRGFICMPRPETMSHMLAGKNLGLITVRQVAEGVFSHLFLTRDIVESRITLSNKGIGFLYPLYFYTIKAKKSLFSEEETHSQKHGQIPNLAPKFVGDFSQRLGLAFTTEGRGDLETIFGPEDVFFYTYAIFHSPTYRERYAEFLKMDFPRLPLTGSKPLFAALVGLGAELTALHLMESPALERFITTFPISGSQVVEGVRYEENSRRVYINAQQYFEGVPPEVWAFTIGGYQVCHKWLKDRKGRTLSDGDQHHYQKIVVALAETIRLMGETDAVIDAHGGWPIDSPHESG